MEENNSLSSKEKLINLINSIEREDIIAYIYYFIKTKFKVG